MATLGLGGHAGVADTADVLPQVCSAPREGQAGRVRAGVHLHGARWDCRMAGLEACCWGIGITLGQAGGRETA